MVKISEVIVVEGRYDKNTLSQVVDAKILQTNGFGIMKDRAQLDLLRRAAEKHGLIVFTDSDGAGLVIRNFLKSAIPGQYLKHAYIPDIAGKEKRKATPGKEGKLGVEGMRPGILIECLRRAGATLEGEVAQRTINELTKVDMAELGLSGAPDSKVKRIALAEKLAFPAHLSSNALLMALNMMYSKEEVFAIVESMQTGEFK